VTRFVVEAGAVLHLLAEDLEVSAAHRLLAPTLLRSHTLSLLHEAVHRGEVTADTARDHLARFNRMKIRLLGDAVLRRRAWEIADRLGWASTYDAEYVALTQLQADAGRDCVTTTREGSDCTNEGHVLSMNSGEGEFDAPVRPPAKDLMIEQVTIRGPRAHGRPVPVCGSPIRLGSGGGTMGQPSRPCLHHQRHTPMTPRPGSADRTPRRHDANAAYGRARRTGLAPSEPGPSC
jgi:predicted nucleic acid-binding protein